MDAQIVAIWATQNGFDSLDPGRYRRRDEGRTITIEIKKMSVVLIDQRLGLQPRIVSRLFKEIGLGGARLEQLMREG